MNKHNPPVISNFLLKLFCWSEAREMMYFDMRDEHSDLTFQYGIKTAITSHYVTPAILRKYIWY